MQTRIVVAVEGRDRELSVDPSLLPDGVRQLPNVSRTVVVPIGAFDRRAALALRYVPLVPADRVRIVHVETNVDAARELGLAWMRAIPTGWPIELVPSHGGVAATVAAVVAHERRWGGEVVLLVGELSMRGMARRLLHDGTAGKIAAAVVEDLGVRVVRLPVVVP